MIDSQLYQISIYFCAHLDKLFLQYLNRSKRYACKIKKESMQYREKDIEKKNSITFAFYWYVC